MPKQLYTPYGFRDVLFEDAWQQNHLCDLLHDVFLSFGYRDVETPLVEYLDVFNDERGSVSTQDMYKFVDRDGELLVLRPDMTPALARMVSFYFRENDLPIRVTSAGSTFRYNSRYSAKLRQLKQTGIELYGKKTPAEDAEVLSVAVQCMKALKLQDFRVTIGHAKLVADLLSAFGIPSSEQEEWSRQIESKNEFALEQKASELDLNAVCRELLQLVTKAGGKELIEQGAFLADQLQDQALIEDFNWLLALVQDLSAYGVVQEVLFDPGMKPELKYYTGVVFKGYALGAAEPVLDGGRYDALLSQMGVSWAATGFAFYQDRLMEAMKYQDLFKAPQEILLLTGQNESQLIQKACELRAEGKKVMMIPGLTQEEAADYVKRHHLASVIRLDGEGKVSV